MEAKKPSPWQEGAEVAQSMVPTGRWGRIATASVLFFVAFSLVWLLVFAFGISTLYVYLPTMAVYVLVTGVLVGWWIYAVRKHKGPYSTSGLLVGQIPICLLVSLLLAMGILCTVHLLGVYWVEADIRTFALGGVLSTECTVWARSSEHATFWVESRPVGAASWATSASVSLGEEDTDHTGTVVLAGLTPETEYECVVVFGERDAVADGTRGDVMRFKTLPAPGTNTAFRFGSGSCTNKLEHMGRELSGLQHVTAQELDFFMHLGDVIYADIPLTPGLGTNKDAYRSVYRQHYSDRWWQQLVQTTPMFFMYDDHEVVNDYSDGFDTDMYQVAIREWQNYAGSMNPQAASYSAGSHYYSFQAGSAAFFVFDVRQYKSKTQLIGEAQLAAAKAWLNGTRDAPFRFLVSSSPWTRNYKKTGGEKKEGWVWFKKERQAVLDFITDNGIENAIFVSGDAHVMGVFELAPGVIEVSASPLGVNGVPFSVFDGDADKIVWEQPTFSTDRNTQFATYDVAADAVTIRLYSLDFDAPAAVVRVASGGYTVVDAGPGGEGLKDGWGDALFTAYGGVNAIILVLLCCACTYASGAHLLVWRRVTVAPADAPQEEEEEEEEGSSVEYSDPSLQS